MGVGSPLGDPVHVQYTCNISHVALAGAAPVLSAYEDFLKTGEVPRKLPGPCGSAGGSYRFAPSRSGGRPGAEARGGPDGPRHGRGGGPRGHPGPGPATLVVVDDDRPVTLRVPITNGRFSYTPLSGATTGPVSTYGPVTGTLELARGAPGQRPSSS